MDNARAALGGTIIKTLPKGQGLSLRDLQQTLADTRLERSISESEVARMRREGMPDKYAIPLLRRAIELSDAVFPDKLFGRLLGVLDESAGDTGLQGVMSLLRQLNNESFWKFHIRQHRGQARLDRDWPFQSRAFLAVYSTDLIYRHLNRLITWWGKKYVDFSFDATSVVCGWFAEHLYGHLLHEIPHAERSSQKGAYRALAANIAMQAALDTMLPHLHVRAGVIKNSGHPHFRDGFALELWDERGIACDVFHHQLRESFGGSDGGFVPFHLETR